MKLNFLKENPWMIRKILYGFGCLFLLTFSFAGILSKGQVDQLLTQIDDFSGIAAAMLLALAGVNTTPPPKLSSASSGGESDQ